MVTVELAIGLVTAVVLASSLAGLSLLGVAQATVAESSAQLARQTARADEEAVRHARERVPDGATVDVRREQDGVTATVRLAVNSSPGETKSGTFGVSTIGPRTVLAVSAWPMCSAATATAMMFSLPAK